MPMSKSDPEKENNEVTLEDLLRVKRAERPDDAFWGRFDRELHQRMLQTLMKKDPWFVQLMRGLRARLVQSTAVVAATACVAMFAIRPAFILSNAESGSGLAASGDARPVESVEVAAPEISWSREGLAMWPRDFATDEFRARTTPEDASYTRDFRTEKIELVAFERSAYSADHAFSEVALDGPTVASFVY